MDKINRIEELVKMLNRASYEYYNTGYPIMDDAEFDYLLDELQKLEIQTGVILKDSPTINAGSKVATVQNKIVHEHPMLSLDKIHSISEIKDFCKNKPCIASIKLDGLSCSATYNNGVLTRLETRGNGEVGTDIMIHKNCIEGLPRTINHKGKYVIDGECIITYDRFNAVNKTLGENEKFSNPRNMASGSLNLLDSNISAKRGLTFLAWNVIEDSECFGNSMSFNLENAKDLGFFVVPYTVLYHYDDNNTLKDVLNHMKMQAGYYGYPMDGVVFSYNDIAYGKSLGRTDKFFKHSIAYKYEDELYETVLKDIEWNTSKTGLINPVAVFEPVDLDGAITTRATLHNISYIEDLELGYGDKITVYRSNMVIPKVHDNLTRSNTWTLPDKCPCCGAKAIISNENGSKTLYCTNPECPAQLLGKLAHFVSRNAINIDGLSEQTLQKFISKGWLKSFRDIMHLKEYADEIMKLDGFGKQSVNKLLVAIEKSRNTTLERFLYSLSIPLIGRSASKDIAKKCIGRIDSFRMVLDLDAENAFLSIDGFGKEMNKSLVSWWCDNKVMFNELAKEFIFEDISNKNTKCDLSNKIFVITGSLNKYKNREELISVIESLGGKVSGSVSVKTNYLINNNAESNSSKNKKANELGIPIITEDEFNKMIS